MTGPQTSEATVGDSVCNGSISQNAIIVNTNTEKSEKLPPGDSVRSKIDVCLRGEVYNKIKQAVRTVDRKLPNILQFHLAIFPIM